ncbi:MCE family protein [Rhodococcus marinonascens]|uniref:MCE family protein n=1 Tax=Rhodococcus marinonascens TaxID=38311 RepID=UPI0009320D06|nr:MCE family protein [Rhodococcus marinonascens]
MIDVENGAARSGRRRAITLIAGIVVAALVITGAVWWLFARAGTTKITAYFDKSVGIYEGSDVRILGVKVGSVDSVEPQGAQVKVEMRVDRGVDIPVDAKAAQITPSVVSDRYIQLTPVYTGGAKMASGAIIERQDTATPVEVDQLYESIDQLSNALGPNGANKDGALSQFIETGAANLDGNGEALGESIGNLSDAARTLNESRGQIFDTVKNLQVFVGALAANDQQVREFNSQLSDLSGFLAGEREDLGAALNQLAIALGDVSKFVADNREILAKNVDDLVPVTQTLADNRESLVNSLTLLPLAISNLANSYDAESGTLASRVVLQDLEEPAALVCKLIDLGKLKPGDPQFEQLGRQMRPLIDNCMNIASDITQATSSPSLVLPFGIMSGENIQRMVTPGTVPGVVSPRLEGVLGGEGQ